MSSTKLSFHYRSYQIGHNLVIPFIHLRKFGGENGFSEQIFMFLQRKIVLSLKNFLQLKQFESILSPLRKIFFNQFNIFFNLVFNEVLNRIILQNTLSIPSDCKIVKTMSKLVDFCVFPGCSCESIQIQHPSQWVKIGGRIQIFIGYLLSKKVKKRRGDYFYT